MKLIEQFMESDERLERAKKEWVRMLRKVHENWKPQASNATKFGKEQAKKIVERLEEDNSLFVRAYGDDYIIMKVIPGGPIHYYSEEKNTELEDC